jgi:tetratricopeptide (TPR) repeat protein
MNAKTLLAAIFAALLLAASGANAQVSRDLSERKQAPARKDKQEAAAQTFANATREEPAKLSPNSKFKGKLSKLQALYNAEEFDAAIASAEAILADPKANPAERSSAASAAAFAAMRKDDDNARAIAFAKRALDENGLQNAMHFPLLLELARMHSNDEQYVEALAVVDKFLAETKSNDPAAHEVRGYALYQMDKYPEAIDALKLAVAPDGTASGNVNQMLMRSYVAAERYAEAITLGEAIAAKTPDDKKAQLNLANVYAEAEQPAKAVAVFERLRAAGKLTDSGDYEAGIRVLANLDGREKDLIAFINEGLTKGILKPNAQVYGQLGQAYYNADQVGEAIAAWEKAAPLAKDGELYLNLAIVSLQDDRYAGAKAAAQQAIAKGVRKPGKAWLVIAAAEQGLGNDAGIVAAYREAAKDPATRDEAHKMLQKFGGK